jgi:uncharacterized protein
MALAAIAAFVGASVQSATGFGFALILGPALFAVLSPYKAVTALLVLGLLLNVLVLLDRAGSVRWRTIGPLLAFAFPGLAAGAALLSVLPKPVLQIAVGAAVVGAAVLQWHSEETTAPQGRPPPRSAWAVGLASGALTTSTSVSGPPIVLWLQAQRLTPGEMRASLAASFLVLNLAGGLALLAAGGGGSLAGPSVLLPLVVLVGLGYAVGTRAHERLDHRRFRSLVVALVVATGLASAVAGLVSL